MSPRPGRIVERVLVVCEAEALRGVLLAHSDDAGERWTPMTRIDAPAGVDGWTKTPAVAASPTGVIVVTYYGRGADTASRCHHLYATSSVDGGNTFLPSVQVSSRPSCPETGTNGSAVSSRFPSGGEYSGLVAVGPRDFVAVWADSRDGLFQLRSARISVPDAASEPP
ncbi:MAG: hypothetical protein V4617_07840 [Gemmatimonadota bacterium]